jgi:hypothetical protein
MEVPMSDFNTDAVKLSLRLDSHVYAAIEQEALAERREVTEHIQRILAEHAITKKLVDAKKAAELQLMWSVVARAVETARKFCREGAFTSDITHKSTEACMADKAWAADYEKYVEDNPYKHGNPRKKRINQEIGLQIRKGIGGIISKGPNGKPAKVTVTGSIIQSFTPMDDYDKSAVL